MRYFHVYKIKWDTDGKRIKNIPKAMAFVVDDLDNAPDEEIEEYLSDALSDNTGWCHGGFRYDELKPEDKKYQEIWKYFSPEEHKVLSLFQMGAKRRKRS